jgi:hypothetical protein
VRVSSGSQALARAQHVLERGIELHNAGRLDVATMRYQEVLRLVPNQPDALHL